MSDKILHQDSGEFWTAIHADCVEAVKALPDESIGYSIYSVPFASLYTYSNSDRDFGNCKDDAEFFGQMAFLIRELLRVTKPGRLTSIHCMNLPTTKTRDGYIGIRDFRGEIVRAFEKEGWIFHSEVCIWKDPVTAMQRTKAIGLLHKQMVKDSCMSRQGIPDYLVTLRKPGENKNPVAGELTDWIGEGTPEEFEKGIRAQWAADKSRDESAKATFPTFKSIMLWQRYASPVWMDINPSDTLQFRSAREQADERHICPLQLQVIERGLELWSNEGDTVLTPFAGIGSEGYVAIEKNRKAICIELKQSYYDQCVANLRIAEAKKKELLLL